jgi:predicted TIM-barrel fold metal-dependent hydrolase
MIIDFHTHAFPDTIAKKAITILEANGKIKAHTNGTISDLMEKSTNAGIDYSIVLPVATSSEKQVKSINTFAIEVNNNYKETHILSFGGLHPNYIDYEEQIIRLKESGIKGIKLHPQYQDTFIDDIKYVNIIDKAFEFGLIVILHAGIDIGIPTEGKVTPDRVLKLLSMLKQKGKLVLAHMGSWRMWEEVYDKLLGLDIYIDTAFSLDYAIQDNKKIPLLTKEQVEAFIFKHGSDHILFGTDSPWAEQRPYIDFINGLNIRDSDKKSILGENALKMLNMV